MRRRILESLLPSQVVHAAKCEFIDHLYLAGTDMDHLWIWVNVSNTLDFGFSPVHLQAQQGGLFTYDS